MNIELPPLTAVLGIVVDDAIIVGENIYRHQEEHGDGMRGSIEGGTMYCGIASCWAKSGSEKIEASYWAT